jgi:hypothetical protein
MKKSKIFLTAGTLALAITAVFATKANKKFALQLKTAVISNSNYDGYMQFKGSSAIFTTSTGVPGLTQAFLALVTSSNHVIQQVSVEGPAGHTNPIYVAP